MRFSSLPAVLLVSAMLAFNAPSAHASGPIECHLTYSMAGWSVFYKTAAGEGTVSCSDGQRLPVSISAKGGGLTFGKSRIDHGVGEFSGVYNIRDVLGGYASAEAHAGAGKSTKAQVVTKGSVSLALTGQGSGWDLGVSFGSFFISA
ncbi:MAG: hypothetical protein M3P99_03410, partial [Pseudomonadota bacterium]|nr:hypothetical protein [Pseudomonadota bacterium]